MILAINTASPRFSIALIKEDGALVGEYTLAGGPKGSRPLFPALQGLLEQASSDLRRIEAVAVAGGPGSFTGLRVGVSIGKGLCQALGVPMIAVPTLEALASQLPYAAHPVCAFIGSKKGEGFAALFRSGETGEMERLSEDTCLRVTGLAEFIEGKTIFIGDDYGSQSLMIQEAVGRNALLPPSPFWSTRAAPMGAIALKRFLVGDFDDLEGYAPSYLRSPEIGPNPFRAPENRSNPVV